MPKSSAACRGRQLPRQIAQLLVNLHQIQIHSRPPLPPPGTAHPTPACDSLLALAATMLVLRDRVEHWFREMSCDDRMAVTTISDPAWYLLLHCRPLPTTASRCTTLRAVLAEVNGDARALATGGVTSDGAGGWRWVAQVWFPSPVKAASKAVLDSVQVSVDGTALITGLARDADQLFSCACTLSKEHFMLVEGASLPSGSALPSTWWLPLEGSGVVSLGTVR